METIKNILILEGKVIELRDELVETINNSLKIKDSKIKEITYKKICDELFILNEPFFYINEDCEIIDCTYEIHANYIYDANICTSEQQCKKLLAINKLLNVAKYFNSKRNFAVQNEFYSIYINLQNYLEVKTIGENDGINIAVFYNFDDAQKAIDILDSDLYDALSYDY